MLRDLIIFGAGASFGSDIAVTPPLGYKLFDDLVIFNPEGWGKIDTNLAGIFRKDFEIGMKELSQSNLHALPPLQRAMALYFFRFIPSKSNLYIRLAERIKKKNWQGAIATFNYERLLELSLLSEGFRPVAGRESTSSNEIEICFPHGCCHLFCTSVRGTAQGISFSGTNVSTNGPIEVISDSLAFRDRIINDAFPPVMSYFIPSKITTSGASFIKNHRTRFSELVSQSSIIAVVGLCVRPHDVHIWEPLSETSAKIIYCSGKQGGAEFKIWAEENRKDKENIIIPYYFFDGFEKLCFAIELIE